MHDLSLYLLELLENAVRAGARTVSTGLILSHDDDRLTLRVDDDGHGLNVAPDEALDPFYTTKPGKKTGLGLSLLEADAQAAGGGLRIGHSPLGGAAVEAWLQLSHVDRPPLGDVATTLFVMVATNPEVTFTLSLDDGSTTSGYIGRGIAEAAEPLDHLVRLADGGAEIARPASRG